MTRVAPQLSPGKPWPHASDQPHPPHHDLQEARRLAGALQPHNCAAAGCIRADGRLGRQRLQKRSAAAAAGAQAAAHLLQAHWQS